MTENYIKKLIKYAKKIYRKKDRLKVLTVAKR